MRSWFEIKNAAAPEADIYLYDEIGMWGVTAQAFVDALNAIKAKTINLFVDSPGGSVDNSMAIYNALQRHPAHVNATVDGLAASSASFIIQAANHIAMGKGSTLMIHEPYVAARGGVAELTKAIEMLDVYGENIAGIYAARAGGTADEWRDKMKDETWYKAQDAVDAGLADELAGSDAQNLGVFNLSKFQHPPIDLLKVHNRTDDESVVIPGTEITVPSGFGSEFRKSASYTPEPTLEELFTKQAAAGPVTVGGN